jgi:twitching motility protein PilI
MTKEKQQHPIILLQELELRCRNNAPGLPQQEEAEAEWGGIGFSLGELKLLAPLGEVTEILSFPTLSRVPGVKPWLLGVANIRGNLLPVMDLAGYLSGTNTVLNKKSRVLVMNYQGVYSGLLVDDVMGLRRFEEEDLTTELPQAMSSLYAPYLDRAYHKGQEHWVVMSMHKLADNPAFLQAAR